MKRESAIVLAFAGLLGACDQSPPSVAKVESAPINSEAMPVAAGDGLVAPFPPAPDELTFDPVVELDQQAPGIVPQLRLGSVPADPQLWKSSFRSRYIASDGQMYSCTAALVGPGVVLTAAHCIPDSGKIQFNYGGRGFSSSCTVHPKYADKSDISADFALCKVGLDANGKPLALSPGQKFETIDLRPMDSLLNKPSQNPVTLILTGYGCKSDLVAEKGEIDGKFRIGLNDVSGHSGQPPRPGYESLHAPLQSNTLFTPAATATNQVANVCPGDSGGPAFRSTAPDGSTSDLGKRLIVGVNSRVFYRDNSMTHFGGSLISATGGPAFAPWAKKWLADNGATACGLGAVVPNCR